MTTNLPAYLQNLHRVSDKIPVSSLQPPRLSIDGNAFTLIDAGNKTRVGAMDPQAGLCLDVHIIDANERQGKRYRPEEEKYKEENPTPPTCWSDDSIKPDPEVQQKQNENCLTCKWNERGSKIGFKGTPVKACEDVQKIAFVVPGMEVVYQLTITPGSLSAFRKYNKMLVEQHYDIAYVITRIFFSSQGVLGFHAVRVITEPEAIAARQVLDAGGSDFAVSRRDKPKELPAAQATAPQINQGAMQIGYPPSPGRDRADAIVARTLNHGTQTPYMDKAFPDPAAPSVTYTATREPTAPRRGRPPKARENETVVGPGPIPPTTPWPGVAQEFPQGEPASPFIAAPPAAIPSPPQMAASSVIPPSPSFGVEPHPLPPTQEIEDAIARAFELPV